MYFDGHHISQLLSLYLQFYLSFSERLSSIHIIHEFIFTVVCVVTCSHLAFENDDASQQEIKNPIDCR